MKLKSDLKHTMSARARAESRKEKARGSLKVAEVKFQEVKDGLQATQDDLMEARDGLRATRTELQAVRDELQSSRMSYRELGKNCVLLETSYVIKWRCLMGPVGKLPRLQSLLNARLRSAMGYEGTFKGKKLWLFTGTRL